MDDLSLSIASTLGKYKVIFKEFIFFLTIAVDKETFTSNCSPFGRKMFRYLHVSIYSFVFLNARQLNLFRPAIA